MTTPSNPLPECSLLSLIPPPILHAHAIPHPRVSDAASFPLITITPHPTLPLSLHTYTPETVHHQLWDALTIAARGLITETSTGRVISRSFPKFFNFDERNAYRRTGTEARVVVEEKVNGSIGQLFFYDGRWMWASKAAFKSPCLGIAEEIMETKYSGVVERLDRRLTYVFEILHPGVLVGGGRRELVLLAAFYRNGSEPGMGVDWRAGLPFPRPREVNVDVGDWRRLQEGGGAGEEGFVVTFWRNEVDTRPQRVKVKFTSYRMLMKAMKNAASPEEVRAYYEKSVLGTGSLEMEYMGKKMAGVKENYVKALRTISDDNGGESWVMEIESLWDGVDARFRDTLKCWEETVTILSHGGFADRDGARKGAFLRRIRKRDIEKKFRPALVSWYDKREDSVFQQLVRLVELPSAPTPEENKIPWWERLQRKLKGWDRNLRKP